MRLESTQLSSISAFSKDLKKFKLHIDYSGVSEQTKPLQPVGQAAEFQFGSKFKPFPVICHSLQKAIREENRRFKCKFNGRALALSRAPAQLGLVGRASTKTGYFRLGGSRSGQRLARLRKKCYHS